MDGSAIPRHKTAIIRGDFSRPVKCALRDGLLDQSITFFDYGCGRGEDLELLAVDGFTASGWDPVYKPDGERNAADIVNLGYVINVVEDPEERNATLLQAWELCRQALVVSAQVLVNGRGKNPVEFGDGVLTGRGTFQKFYEQGDLKAYLEDKLEAEAIPAAVGVFYLFKDEARRQQFLANRFRRREIVPRRRPAEDQSQENRELLDALMGVVATFGRLPEADEFTEAPAIIDRFGSLKRAFAVVKRITGDSAWEQIAKRRAEDMLVYLALARFRKRPPLILLPRSLQRDIKAFFGGYSRACEQADELLFGAGNAELVDAACKRSAIGKLLPDSLYVHRSALNYLEPILRVYEGCARAYLGEIEDANIIKLHRFSGRISYLSYPDFDTDPHPALVRSVKLCMRTRQLESQAFGRGGNPPVLHRKEAFLHAEHPLHAKFERLTQQEERHGLLEETNSIGTRDGWTRRLEEKGFALKGHRLIRQG
ncbi:DNA phosphorothioation-associated putative methyltransferase [Aquisphaera insulae]|uniref:DNA phosphorothioation-associated putative methyltransferase n=1 Tax=Aquisphaera insulae TaxID=2712864 RepID=UPI0013EAFE5E|nr:DNA phosphorothioation-associated putative methyltransferase [Aquisphaera insulae]